MGQTYRSRAEPLERLIVFSIFAVVTYNLWGWAYERQLHLCGASGVNWEALFRDIAALVLLPIAVSLPPVCFWRDAQQWRSFRRGLIVPVVCLAIHWTWHNLSCLLR